MVTFPSVSDRFIATDAAALSGVGNGADSGAVRYYGARASAIPPCGARHAGQMSAETVPSEV
ncbi:MAG: hypothetical protein Tsb0032_02790 [Kiloniellaceae bacterium]